MAGQNEDSWLTAHRQTLGFAGLLVALTGLTMVLNPTHAAGMEWIGLPVVVAGSVLFVWVTWPKVPQPGAGPRSVGSGLIQVLTWRGRLVSFFPVLGTILFAADLAYNYWLSRTPALLTEDVLVLLTAGYLLAFSFVPIRYARERDFVLLFFVFIDLLLVAPFLAARLLSGNVDTSVDLYSWTLLAPELGAVLSLLGISNTVHAVVGYTAPGLSFTPLQMSVPVTIVITTSCSGIYSFGIFASGYLAYILTECEKISRRLWLLLGLGFIASYAANLLRMVVIVLVGYYTDSAQSDLQNLLLAHSYAGWVIFLGWILLFWGLLLHFITGTTRGHAQSGSIKALTPPSP